MEKKWIGLSCIFVIGVSLFSIFGTIEMTDFQLICITSLIVSSILFGKVT